MQHSNSENLQLIQELEEKLSKLNYSFDNLNKENINKIKSHDDVNSLCITIKNQNEQI